MRNATAQDKLEYSEVLFENFYSSYVSRLDSLSNTGVLIDPILKSKTFVYLLNHNSQELKDSLSIYRGSLVSLLKQYSARNQTEKLNILTKVFYLLCTEEYCKTILEVSDLYKNNIVPCSVLESLIFQDFTLSNNLSKHFSDSLVDNTISSVLMALKQRENKSCESFYKNLVQFGVGDDEFNLNLELIQPPAFKHNCK